MIPDLISVSDQAEAGRVYQALLLEFTNNPTMLPHAQFRTLQEWEFSLVFHAEFHRRMDAHALLHPDAGEYPAGLEYKRTENN